MALDLIATRNKDDEVRELVVVVIACEARVQRAILVPESEDLHMGQGIGRVASDAR